MPTNILMPALSPTMEKGNLAKWLKKEGDTVKPGDIIAEIETDKATMEVEAVDEGTLAKIVVAEGTADVPVNQVIAVLANEGEDVKAAAASRPVIPPQQAKPAKAAGAAATAAPAAPKPVAAPAPAATPAPPYAPKAAGNRASLRRSLVGSRRKPASTCRASPAPGPHGRVIARDVDAAKSGKGLRPAAPVSLPRRRRRAGHRTVDVGPADPRAVRRRQLRGRSARRHAPHHCAAPDANRRRPSRISILTIDCNIGKLLQAREDINASAPKDKDGKPAYKLSVNDFVIKALALALQRIPDANVSWTETGMLKHKHSDVGVAVAMPGGLITPIVRSAETKSLSAISNEMKDFAARARDRKLKPHEYQGGTTAVSNLGMYGIKDFTAVINPPHATILAVGAGEERAVVVNGKIEAAHIDECHAVVRSPRG